MISLRAYRRLDEDFVYHSWLASLDRSIRGVNDAVRPVVDESVKQGRIVIACSEEDEDHILGWLSWGELDGKPVLLYLFVKKSLRGNGIGTRMLREVFPSGEVLTAFWSFWIQRYHLKEKWSLRYNAMIFPILLKECLDGEAEVNS
jgi:GNAT superfamily N-acetyltransferase